MITYYVVNVLDKDDEGMPYVRYAYGPFELYDTAVNWTRNFPIGEALVSKLIRPTYNAD